VYKARQTKLDRLVALKILPAEVGRDPAFAARFTREARTLAKLNHSHIVGVHDFGEVEGLFYFVMEFVDGGSLRRLIRPGPVAPGQALDIVSQVCTALQYAHEEGVVHRDVKPENILLDKRGQVKIADFGLAKLVERTPASLQLTASQQVMGTWNYMAPEQMERPLQVDHRADIYSLGVVLYEMLTRGLPLGRFALPSQKAAVDGRVDELVLRALEREPEQRFQRVSEMKTVLDSIRIASPSPIPGGELSATAVLQPARPGQPHAGPSWWSGLVMLFCLAGIALSLLLPWGNLQVLDMGGDWETLTTLYGYESAAGIASAIVFLIVLLLLTATGGTRPIPLWQPLIFLLVGLVLASIATGWLLSFVNKISWYRPKDSVEKGEQGEFKALGQNHSYRFLVLDERRGGIFEAHGKKIATHAQPVDNLLRLTRRGPYVVLGLGMGFLFLACLQFRDYRKTPSPVRARKPFSRRATRWPIGTTGWAILFCALGLFGCLLPWSNEGTGFRTWNGIFTGIVFILLPAFLVATSPLRPTPLWRPLVLMGTSLFIVFVTALYLTRKVEGGVTGLVFMPMAAAVGLLFLGSVDLRAVLMARFMVKAPGPLQPKRDEVNQETHASQEP
jgi:hypothetical protein